MKLRECRCFGIIAGIAFAVMAFGFLYGIGFAPDWTKGLTGLAALAALVFLVAGVLLLIAILETDDDIVRPGYGPDWWGGSHA